MLRIGAGAWANRPWRDAFLIVAALNAEEGAQIISSRREDQGRAALSEFLQALLPAPAPRGERLEARAEDRWILAADLCCAALLERGLWARLRIGLQRPLGSEEVFDLFAELGLCFRDASDAKIDELDWNSL